MKTIGVDIGGTKTAIGIIDYKTAKISKKIIFPSKSFKSDTKNLNLIIEELDDYLEDEDPDYDNLLF